MLDERFRANLAQISQPKPWFEPFSVRRSTKHFKLFHLRSAAPEGEQVEVESAPRPRGARENNAKGFDDRLTAPASRALRHGSGRHACR